MIVLDLFDAPGFQGFRYTSIVRWTTWIHSSATHKHTHLYTHKRIHTGVGARASIIWFSHGHDMNPIISGWGSIEEYFHEYFHCFGIGAGSEAGILRRLHAGLQLASVTSSCFSCSFLVVWSQYRRLYLCIQNTFLELCMSVNVLWSPGFWLCDCSHAHSCSLVAVVQLWLTFSWVRFTLVVK